MNRERRIGALALTAAVLGGTYLLDSFGPGRSGCGSTNEGRAVASLRTIALTQELFRTQDREGDTVLDYGTLSELSDQSLIDAGIGAGTMQGYVFQIVVSSSVPEALWSATANPAVPGVTGDRCFAINQTGVVFYTTTGPILLDPRTCVIPRGPKRVGK